MRLSTAYVDRCGYWWEVQFGRQLGVAHPLQMKSPAMLEVIWCGRRVIGLCWWCCAHWTSRKAKPPRCSCGRWLLKDKLHSFLCLLAWYGYGVWRCGFAFCMQMDEWGYCRILEENWLGVVRLVELEVISLLMNISVHAVTLNCSRAVQCWEKEGHSIIFFYVNKMDYVSSYNTV